MNPLSEMRKSKSERNPELEIRRSADRKAFSSALERRAAFSVVELLVVIAVIAILISLLMPTLAKGKARASGVRCVSNNKQMMLAWQMYTDESDGKLLFASADSNDPQTRAATWVTGTLDFWPANRSNWDVEEDIKKSPLWPYCGSPEIWKCPADTSGVWVHGRFYPRVRSLAMSLWVGGFGGTVAGFYGYNFRIYRHLNDVVDPGPSQTWLFMDQREDSINMGNFVTVMHGWPDAPGQMRFIEDFPASYHHRAAGISFFDGHAEIHRWVDPRTMPPLRKGTNVLQMRGVVPSPNNADIRWLQERATRKRK
jgi:type II secretory pathway pseudopilin PulG